MRDASALDVALSRYAAEQPSERATVLRFIDLPAYGPPAFRRDHLPGHFVASVAVVNP